MHGNSRRKRIKRGLFERKKLKKVFNADLAAAYNILITRVLKLIGIIGRPGIKSPEREDVIPKLLLAATFAL
jgi:transposase